MMKSDLNFKFAGEGRAIISTNDISDTLPFDQAEDKFVRLFQEWTDEYCSR